MIDDEEIREFVKQQIPDWDDETVSTSRFKAFSGQRSDWQPKFLFWRSLILKISHHFGIFLINPSHVKNCWFNRNGLNPLCIDHVLSLMYHEGDIVRRGDLLDPTSGRISKLFQRLRLFMAKPTDPEVTFDDDIIVLSVVKDRADEVIKTLSETHWTSSCIVTMKKFQTVSGGSNEASVILSYLSGCGKACYLSTRKTEFLEGVKVSLSTATVSSTTTLDNDLLQLIWTTERLEQQLDVIDQRYETSRKSALASLSSGNKKVALRHARQMKLTSESREKCTSLLNRVEEVVNLISNAESNKKVSEAIQIGAHAIKENNISIEEVELCLQELDESVDSQKELDCVLESTPLYTEFDDEDIEDELQKLELEMTSDTLHATETGVDKAAGEASVSESTDILCDALSSLKIADGISKGPGTSEARKENPKKYNEPKKAMLETA